MSRRGRIIAVEGLDGTGKSTLALALAERLGAHRMSTPPESIRQVRAQFDWAFSACSTSRTLAYGATVIHAGVEAIQRAQAGQDVVIDRYWLSTLVYAPGAAMGALDAMAWLVQPADLTLFLTAPLALRAARMQGRGLVSADDARTLDAEADALLRARYLGFSGLGVVGRWVELDAVGGVGEVLGRAVACAAPQDLAPPA